MEIIASEKLLDTDSFVKVVINKQRRQTIHCCINFPSINQEKECMKKIKRKCSIKKNFPRKIKSR